MANSASWATIVRELAENLGQEKNHPMLIIRQTTVGFKVRACAITKMRERRVHHHVKHHNACRIHAIKEASCKLMRKICQVHRVNMDAYVRMYESHVGREGAGLGPRRRRTGNRQEYLRQFCPAGVQEPSPEPSSSGSCCEIGSPPQFPMIGGAWVLSSSSDA